MKKISKSENKSANPIKAKGASTSAKAEKTVEVTSNARLVDALSNLERSKQETKSYLVDCAIIITEEQLSKEEVVISIMEARGCDRKYAGEQYSRLQRYVKNPDLLEQLKAGEIDLKTAAARGTKKQANPSTAKKLENASKVITRSITAIINKAKETGMDLKTIIHTLTVAAKKNGLK